MPPSSGEDGASSLPLLLFWAPDCEQHTSVVYQPPSLVLCHTARAKIGSPGVSGSFWSTHDGPWAGAGAEGLCRSPTALPPRLCSGTGQQSLVGAPTAVWCLPPGSRGENRGMIPGEARTPGVRDLHPAVLSSSRLGIFRTSGSVGTEAPKSAPMDYFPADILPFLRQRLLKIKGHKCTHCSL